MTAERLLELIDVYGADMRRWPDGERAAARALLASGPPALRERLQQAALLDQWLDSHGVAAPDDALLRRVVASSVSSTPVRQPGWPPRWWWPSAGLAAIALTGALTGGLVMSVALSSATQANGDWLDRGTAFNRLPAEWSEE
jgi:hypothetical protein